MVFKKINYADLNARQKENYNYQQLSALLAHYGFNTIRLSDDWQGSDFIAQHIDGIQIIKVQLKGRLTLDKKYISKDLYISFCENNEWYLYPHDQLLSELKSSNTAFELSDSWQKTGVYHWPSLSDVMKQHINQYKLQ